MNPRRIYLPTNELDYYNINLDDYNNTQIIIAKKGKDLELVAFAKKYEEIFLFSKYRPKKFN